MLRYILIDVLVLLRVFFSSMSCSYAKECDSCEKSAFIHSLAVLNSESWRLACGMLYGN